MQCTRGPITSHFSELAWIHSLVPTKAAAARKQYLPAEACGEDVELAANSMPAYWRRMQNSAVLPVAALSLPVVSPPVMCWICGDGYLHNSPLSWSIVEKHMETTLASAGEWLQTSSDMGQAMHAKVSCFSPRILSSFPVLFIMVPPRSISCSDGAVGGGMRSVCPQGLAGDSFHSSLMA